VKSPSTAITAKKPPSASTSRWKEAGAGAATTRPPPSIDERPKRSPRSPRRCWSARSWMATRFMQLIKGQPLAPLAASGGRQGRGRTRPAGASAPQGGRPCSRALGRGASPARVISAVSRSTCSTSTARCSIPPPTSWRHPEKCSPPTGAPPRPIFNFLKDYIGHHLAAPFGEIFPDYGPAQIDETHSPVPRHLSGARPQVDARIPRRSRGRWPRSPAANPPPTTKGTPTTRAVLRAIRPDPVFRPRARHRRLPVQARARRDLTRPGRARRPVPRTA